VTQDRAEGLGRARPLGVIVNGVYPNGPAAEAGLDVGDVIVAVNGRDVEDPEALRFRLATLPVGGTADITVLRDGAETHLAVALLAAPETPARDETEIGGRNPLNGCVVANLSPALAEELAISGTWEGVIILGMARSAIAARAGLRPGDVLLGINGTDIGMVRDLVALLETPAERWEITFRREGKVRTVVVS
jgi:serine protease Do